MTKIIDLQDLSASTAAGKRFATAVPEVVMTIADLPAPVAIPKARNAAERSSIALYKFNPDSSSRPPAAKASGDDRLPGQRTICSRPFSWNPLNR